jgi:signal peptidase I
MYSVSVTRRQKKYRRIKNFLLRLCLYIAGLFIVISLGLFCVRNFGTQIVMIDQAMASTLQSEDVVLLDKMAYRLGEPQRMDIVVVRIGSTEHGLSYIRRIVGLPGDKIRITDGQLVINDAPAEITFNQDAIEDAGTADQEIVLADDEYFVLSDNYNNSRDDSRLDSFGMISKSQIAGKVWFRIMPLSDIGKIR